MVNRMLSNLPGNMHTAYFENLTKVISKVDNKLDYDINLLLTKPEHIKYFQERKSIELLGRSDGSWEEIYSKIPSFYKFYFVSDFIEKIKNFVEVIYYTHIDNLTAMVIVESINTDIYKYIYNLVPPGCSLVLFNKTKVKTTYGGFYIGQPTIISHVSMSEGLASYNFINKDMVFLPHGAVVSSSASVDILNGSFRFTGSGEVSLIKFQSKGLISVRLEPNVEATIYIDEVEYTGPMQPLKPFVDIKVVGTDIEINKIIVRMEE